MHVLNSLKLTVPVLMLLAVAGCGGGDSLGGNVTEFKTSVAYATADTPRLEADLVTGNTCSANGSEGGSIVTESVTFQVTTQALTTNNPLPISISGYTVSFRAKNAGIPDLTDLTSNYTVPAIAAGSTVSIPVAITTDLQKLTFLQNNPEYVCGGLVAQYDVTVRFHASEVGSGDGSKDIVAGLVMALADRN